MPAKLEKVVPHIRYNSYGEILALTDYVMTASNCLTPWAIATCLNLHPILVIKQNDKSDCDSYFCVGGLRSLLLAQSVLGLGAEVKVILVEPCDDVISVMISADILFTHFLFSIRNPETLGEIFNSIPHEHLNSLLVERACSKTGFAEQTSYVYNSLFPPSKAK